MNSDLNLSKDYMLAWFGGAEHVSQDWQSQSQKGRILLARRQQLWILSEIIINSGLFSASNSDSVMVINKHSIVKIHP